MNNNGEQQEDLNTFVTNAEFDAESRAEAMNEGATQLQAEDADAPTNIVEDENLQ
ncbi:hypothetical protein NV379_19380 [Paenibacillus sp. N1-5-1-14]|uniref:hypothetical protein n=1 Tax=Paenibacillus radicibacter TaxID=2972488 RepID=UPI002158F958|nr:hypothetical protein [Paenibacillus radicibacter]MCR8644818.1 hypothetical protein [Paenibacillus radicibacter]